MPVSNRSWAASMHLTWNRWEIDNVMITTYPEGIEKTTPLCPVFGTCGGCTYQDIAYTEELGIKEAHVTRLFLDRLSVRRDIVDPIVASPNAYHYRHRLDLSFLRSKKTGTSYMGFKSPERFNIIPVRECAIARRDISDFLPTLKKQAAECLPSRYRLANLTVRTGDDGTVRWGGIGRRSLRLEEEDYFWTVVEGKKIFYSLDTFFQANLFIVPHLVTRIRKLSGWDRNTVLLDLYSGVGLFGIVFFSEVNKVFMVEDNKRSAVLAHYNVCYHKARNVMISEGRVEERLADILAASGRLRKVALVDPPRKGLSPLACDKLAGARSINALLYLSCHPDSLVRDMAHFQMEGWTIKKVIPFDFFPRTRHIETLVWLEPPSLP